jgi:hypothetical protein
MVSKAKEKLVKGVERECRLVPDPDVMFPGGCADPDLGDLEECVIAAAQCQACLTFNTSSGLDLDCEQLDDGSANGTCP